MYLHSLLHTYDGRRANLRDNLSVVSRMRNGIERGPDPQKTRRHLKVVTRASRVGSLSVVKEERKLLSRVTSLNKGIDENPRERKKIQLTKEHLAEFEIALSSDRRCQFRPSMTLYLNLNDEIR